ncbi:phosphoenolpyruvate mutase [Aquabacter spiritensis]|uniref:phosphoenolpyruvate mutase n=1 Tax=Aquabacter spiritensis TaxID=933073 RepID=A0A4R3LXZ2_9HYPH|nr:phosphoenolpyruvate mutase [Aquabacter spiritensis]TCT03527.1 phosphoenolpyruvate mutase [Aquabacter spiritensis]
MSDPTSSNISKGAALRHLLARTETAYLMEAHNALSARIAEEAGFPAVWASGLSISAALGVRDSNEASWTQVLEVLEFMADRTSVPILADGDTGYGNFNNVRRLVRKLEQRGIAGVCIEDKLFPKTNSFLGDDQDLADIAEFCGKIKAGKDSQAGADFVLVARIEALVANRGLDEALARAHAFHAAGADALVIHSKKAEPDEVLAFCAAWGDRCPVILIPTKYFRTPAEMFEAAGVSAVVWANHNLRAAITAMRETSREIFATRSLVGVEARVAPLADVFELSGNAELEAAERRYLVRPPVGQAVILAASRGAELGDLTADRPKCMIDVRGRSLLARQVETLKGAGIKAVCVVTGWRGEAVALSGVSTRANPAWETSGEVASLAAVADRLDAPTLLAFGDILYRRHVLDRLLAAEGDIVLVVDAAATGPADRVRASRGRDEDWFADGDAELCDIGADVADGHGQWIGLARVSQAGAAAIAQEIERLRAEALLDTADLALLFRRLRARGAVLRIVWVAGDWFNINTAFDLASARNQV